MTTCLCGAPNGSLHKHFCPLVRWVPESNAPKRADGECAVGDTYEPNDTVTAHKAFYAGFEGGLEYAWMREACDPAPVVPEWRRMVDEMCWKARAEKAEAAVERVVKLCANTQRRFDSSIRHPTAIAAISIDDVLRALDGDW